MWVKDLIIEIICSPYGWVGMLVFGISAAMIVSAARSNK